MGVADTSVAKSRVNKRSESRMVNQTECLLEGADQVKLKEK